MHPIFLLHKGEAVLKTFGFTFEWYFSCIQSKWTLLILEG